MRRWLWAWRWLDLPLDRRMPMPACACYPNPACYVFKGAEAANSPEFPDFGDFCNLFRLIGGSDPVVSGSVRLASDVDLMAALPAQRSNLSFHRIPLYRHDRGADSSDRGRHSQKTEEHIRCPCRSWSADTRPGGAPAHSCRTHRVAPVCWTGQVSAIARMAGARCRPHAWDGNAYAMAVGA